MAFFPTMLTYDFITLIISAFAGSLMGSYLYLTLLYRPLIKDTINLQQSLMLYRRFYRLNSVLSLIGGLLAALIHNQQAAFILAILAVSYIFANMHILKGLSHPIADSAHPEGERLIQMLKLLQNTVNFSQFAAAGAVVYYLY
ncbi:MAG: hypothetical protein OQL09_09045 [Gammaproteobacteria bacterium]|nr:hypothetical protein [Gammaproteobacteria bacterium]